jgi:hypothetical protein
MQQTIPAVWRPLGERDDAVLQRCVVSFPEHYVGAQAWILAHM